MAGATPCIRDGTVLAFDGAAGNAISVGEPAWWRWLAAPGISRFRFQHGADGFTARRERREGGWYWYAYRKRGGQLRKAYLGRAADLTADRLCAIALALSQRAGQHPDEQPRTRPSRAYRRDVRGHNFSEHPTSFVGREHERADLRRLLETTRLLTATGPGGVGKTRLALQVAVDVLDSYPDGAWLVELAVLADPRLVPHTVASVLGIGERAGQDLLETLSEALRERRLLLVLDNCEHLLQACAQLADGLLRRCPDVRILATSRAVLDVAGETAWRVPSLGLPRRHGREEFEEVARSEAIQLFVERARAARPGFVLDTRSADAVITICQRLDGLPLAIELAAALVRALDPQQIAEHL